MIYNIYNYAIATYPLAVKPALCVDCEAPFACTVDGMCECSNPGLTGPNFKKGKP